MLFYVFFQLISLINNYVAGQTGIASGVATFNCIGITWSGSGANPDTVCNVQYRIEGSGLAWSNGYPLWFDKREAGSGSGAQRPADEYRGSIVGLKPGTTYEILLTAGSAYNSFTVTTWTELFPIGTIVPVTDTNDVLTITTSGTPDAYRLYTPPEGQTAAIDVNNNAFNCIYINAAYVIIRRLVLKGAGEDAIVLGPDAHDVVIENNDISGWGTIGAGSNNQAAVRIKGLGYYAKNVTRIIVQRNKIHNPRDNSNSWDDGGHPLGPNGINFEEAGGNHVIRYNEIYSDSAHYFMDGIGGAENFSFEGFPNANSDIYGNIVRNCYDDAIESEGGNCNVRIWGNFTDYTYTGISSATNSIGPLYIFNNVSNISQRSLTNSSAGIIDNEDRGPFNKTGSLDSSVRGGRTYLFHNTILQPVQDGFVHPRGMGGGPVDNGGPVLNVVSRNNIWQTHRPNEPNWPSVGEWQSPDTSGNTYDYDLYNGNLVIKASGEQESHGIFGTPVYVNGIPLAGPNLFGYFLAQTSPGIDKGDTLDNFNDSFNGNGPDIGAYESGKLPLQFGVNAYLNNNPVTANAGEDITITLPEDSTVLNGTGTTAMGIITSYAWAIVSGPASYTMSDANAATTTLSNLGPGVYVFRLIVMDSSGAYAMDDMTLTVICPNPPVSVTITSDVADNTICLGTPVTFTATSVSAGTTPVYQWKINGNPAGSNQDSFTTSALKNGDVVTVVLTSNITPCAVGNPATSNAITMTVNYYPVSVTIASNRTNNTSCIGTGVTFTATPVNGGSSPVYQWLINGNPVGANQNSYTTTQLNDGDVVTVMLTSDITTCVAGNPATSNAITMTVYDYFPVSVNIASGVADNSICSGANVTFTAIPTNGGLLPIYQWLLNGNPVGLNQNSYTTNGLANGDIIAVLMTSNAACTANNPAISNVITMTVNNYVPVSVSIASGAENNTICKGTSVTFAATAINSGVTPVYQWLVNGNSVGTNQDTYTTSSLNNGDIITVVLTSGITCTTGNPATSNAITMTVNDSPVSVSIASDAANNTICAGTSVVFTATPINGGSSPSYQWKLNGNNVGTNQDTYTTSSLNNGDIITVELTSNIVPCASGNPATSSAIIMTVNNNLPVGVSITSNAANNTICAGTSVTFTASPTNGGSSPVYQWKLNGNNVGSSQDTYTTSSLSNGDIVTVVLTSNIAPCATGNPATSNAIAMTVNNNLPVSVSIASDAADNTICAGTNVTFTATSTNGGSSPVYQWKLNGNNVGSNQDSYSTASLNNGDIITVELTSNIAPCATENPATSNAIAMTVNNNLPVSVSIASDAAGNTICPGTNVTFTATSTNGGPSPVYQWKLNGNNVGTNQDTYTTSSLNNGDIITVVLTSNIAPCATGNPATSNAIAMTVNNNLPVSVSIASDAADNIICPGTNVTFTATPTNGGSSPVYQWKLNGNNVGSNQDSYSTASLNNGDIITVELTSNIAPCATENPATSNAIAMTVNNNLPVSVGIASNAANNTICTGTSVTFTATPTNGGPSPVYQWKLNGNNVGTNQDTYTTSSLNNGDIITVVLTSNIAPCATGNPATSNAIAMTVNNNLPVSVSIASDAADNIICPGTNVTFTATPTNGGSSPVYQWKLNGNNVGTSQDTYTTSSLNNGDIITVVLTSNIAPCATGNPATSNAIAMTVNNNLPVSVSIASDAADNIICPGTNVTFTATPTNGGSSPVYQWKLNGNNVGTSQDTYTTLSLNNGDIITVELTSNIAPCATGNPATSNAITMTVNNNLPVSVSIVSDAAVNTICPGTNVTFTATPTNGGSSPVYQWKLNGNNVGSSQDTYTTSSLSNGDIVTVVLTSNIAPCATGNPATSNAIAMTVNNNLPVSVSIASGAADNTICPGTNVTFTATPTNGGSSPVYQWKLNGNNVGSSQDTYTTSSLSNGDIVTVVLTSNIAPCATGNPATSNAITMTVNNNLPVSVSIASDAADNTICSGTSVTFTATSTNGGSSPVYQWKLNGNNAGNNQDTYTTSSLANGDVIIVVLTSSIAPCATGNPATSNAIAMTVNNNLPVSVNIASDASDNTICPGTGVTFTATPTNGGSSPVYQWKLNGNDAGSNQDTYTTSGLANGDVITVVLTSSIAPCATGNPATSNAIAMTVNNNLPVGVSIASDAANNTICAGTSVVFTTTPINGGSSPVYQWKLNGNNVGTNQDTYTTSSLNNGDIITVELTSNIVPCASGNPATSNAITMTVNNNLPVSVSIASDAANNTICAGTSVTFTASPTNGGSSPVYQWKLNGNNVGSSQDTYTTSSLNNGDIVTVVLTSNIAPCATENPATSNAITMTVNNNLPVSVNITSDAVNNTICAGTSVTFTATSTNGGSSPAYQWKLNGNNVGSNQDTYMTSSLNNGDIITVVLTSNIAPCATGNPATSNAIAMTVNNNLPVSVSIASDAADNIICPGTNVTFTATPTNGGSLPAYQWLLNGNPAGTNQATYTTSTLSNGDVITVVLTSNITPCATGNPATSNAIAMTVNNNLPVSVNITSDAANNTICAGTSVTFTATPTNGGSSPVYQWLLNGNPVGTSQATYTTSTLSNGDVITVVLTSSIATCVSGNPATSNAITMTVNNNLPVNVNIASDVANNTICAGTSVTFTATPTNGGSSPVYQWKLNGNNVGTNQDTYTTSSLNNGDIITVELTSNIAPCATGNPTTSNAITMTVNNNLPVSVSIVSDAAGNTICPGTNVTFTATSTNGGSSPVYQWKLNGNNAGSNQDTYTTSSLANGDVVTVVLTSSIAPCATGNPATSNAITMTVNNNLPVSVGIASNAANNTICAGTGVTFTATPTNGGSSPVYQWKLNGNNAGTNQNTYTTSSLNNGDVVTVELTSNVTPCATTNPATSNRITVTVNNNTQVSVMITSSDADNTIVIGTSVTFKATPVNGGTSPTYQWLLNDNPVGTNQDSYTTSNLTNGDIITVVLTSSIIQCATGNPATSNGIKTTVIPSANNIPPVARTEDDIVLTLPTNTTQLHGNTSFDPDGIIISYNWKQVSGPGQAVITNAFGAIATVSQLMEGIYVFELSVTDNNGDSSTKTTTVTVEKLLDKKLHFNIYPNPVSGILTMRYMDDDFGMFTIKIYNVNASLISEIVMDKTQFSSTATIDVSSYGAGIYFIRLISSDGKEKCTAKFVKI